MIICVCHRVSDRDIARVAQGGCTSFDELQFELSVATCCGKCDDCARETFAHHVALASTAPPPPPPRDCGVPAMHGKVIPIAAQYQHRPMAAAAG